MATQKQKHMINKQARTQNTKLITKNKKQKQRQTHNIANTWQQVQHITKQKGTNKTQQRLTKRTKQKRKKKTMLNKKRKKVKMQRGKTRWANTRNKNSVNKKEQKRDKHMSKKEQHDDQTIRQKQEQNMTNT